MTEVDGPVLEAPPPGTGSSGSAATLEVRGLTVEFEVRDGVVHAVDDVSFEVRPGQTLGIVGESGSGKSVTMLAVLGLIPQPPGRIVSGEARLRGQDLLAMSPEELRRVRGRDVAMVFQNPMTSLNPVFTIGDQIEEAIRIHEPGLKRVALKDRVLHLLDLMRMPDPARHYDQYPHELSGGMAQRAMIAMALVNSPALLIADEATTALDVTIQKEILNLLRVSQEETGAAIIQISHDLGVIAETADQVAVFYAGRIAETGDVRRIFHSPRHPYTVGLIEALPSVRRKHGMPIAIPGQPPSLLKLPSGCPFRPRCFLARDRCAEERPPLRAVDGHGAQRAACHFSSELEGRAPDSGDAATSGSSEAGREPGGLPLLRVEGLVKDYPIESGLALRTRGHVRAVDGIDLTVSAGETLALVGESGSGKSTLGRMLMRIVEPTAGRVVLGDEDVTRYTAREMKAFRKRMQMVVQDPYSSLNPRMRVGSIVEEPLRIHDAGTRRERQARVEELLRIVGLNPEHRNRFPRHLSGGERQRVSLARAMALRPEILILDEPTAALDVSIQAQVMTLLKDVQQEFGLTYIFISHDLGVVRQIADRIAVMRKGKIVELGPAEQVCLCPSHPYSQRLLAAVPADRPELRSV